MRFESIPVVIERFSHLIQARSAGKMKAAEAAAREAAAKQAGVQYQAGAGQA